MRTFYDRDQPWGMHAFIRDIVLTLDEALHEYVLTATARVTTLQGHVSYYLRFPPPTGSSEFVSSSWLAPVLL
jgi:hypothetical protein